MNSVTRETNATVIEYVMCHEDIINCISEDEAELDIDVQADCFLTLRVGEEIAGIYILSPLSSIELDIHAHILPEFRKEHGRDLTRMVFQFFVDSGYEKITAQVPIIYPNVISFCKEFAMIEEGINRLSFLKNGEIHDQIRLGATKDEVISLLEGL